MKSGVLMRMAAAVATLGLIAFGVLVAGPALLGGGGPPVASVSASHLAVGGTWTAGFQVQNLDSSNQATIQITYYNSDGSTAATQSDTIAAGTSKTYFGDTMVVSSGFKGSVVVESDRQIAVITNQLVENPTMAGSYNGISSPSTTVNVPLVMKANGGFDTKLYIQNAGTSTATVYAAFYKTGESTATTVQTLSIAPGAAGELDQSTMSELTPTPWVGSVVITSTQPVAAVVNESNGTQVLTYTGLGSGAQKIYAPLVMNQNSNYDSGLQVQNVGTSSTTVTLTLRSSADGSVVRTDTQPLAAGQSYVWFPIVDTAGFVGSATVEASSGGTIVGIVNQVNFIAGNGTAYSMFSSGTSKVVAPLIMTSNSGWDASLQLQNIGTSSVTVSASAVNTAGQAVSVLGATQTIDPGRSYIWFPVTQDGVFFVGSVTVQGPSGSQLVGVVNQLNPAAGDNFMTYEAVNQ